MDGGQRDHIGLGLFAYQDISKFWLLPSTSASLMTVWLS